MWFVLLFAACSSSDAPAAASDGPPPAAVEVGTVREGQLSDTWTVPGEVRALERAELAAGAAGAVERVGFREGDAVGQGTVLVQVDAALATARVSSARAEMRRLQADLAPMHFLPDVYVTCDVCKGKRYNRETLEVTFKDKSIADVLDMTVEEGAAFFSAVPSIRNKLKTLNEVGLGYIKVGQQATTLSGGEAQRVKLAKELSKTATGSTLYILDEPTTGLHFEDVRRLMEVIMRLVDTGNTVVIIEHNLDVIKQADWLIDLGPEGGDGGGEIVGVGTPEDLATNPRSHTGRFLGPVLARAQQPAKPARKRTAKKRTTRKSKAA